MPNEEDRDSGHDPPWLELEDLVHALARSAQEAEQRLGETGGEFSIAELEIEFSMDLEMRERVETDPRRMPVFLRGARTEDDDITDRVTRTNEGHPRWVRARARVGSTPSGSEETQPERLPERARIRLCLKPGTGLILNRDQ